MTGVKPRDCFFHSYPAQDGQMVFNRGWPMASCDPIGPSVIAGRAVESGAKPAFIPRGTRRRAPSVTTVAAFCGTIYQSASLITEHMRANLMRC